jgi:hypothetical protein
MAKLTKKIFLLSSIVFLFYLSLPSQTFPPPPQDALQSNEPGDTETSLRRAYFTNDTRQEIMQHYNNQLTKSAFFDLTLPTYRLNYPPEDAQALIRDQTRSTFLEEIVHPLRESVFVNGFEPKDPKDAIYIGDITWRQKIIIRYVPSSAWVRLVVGGLTIILIVIVYKDWVRTLLEFKKEVLTKWSFR